MHTFFRGAIRNGIEQNFEEFYAKTVLNFACYFFCFCWFFENPSGDFDFLCGIFAKNYAANEVHVKDFRAGASGNFQ